MLRLCCVHANPIRSAAHLLAGLQQVKGSTDLSEGKHKLPHAGVRKRRGYRICEPIRFTTPGLDVKNGRTPNARAGRTPSENTHYLGFKLGRRERRPGRPLYGPFTHGSRPPTRCGDAGCSPASFFEAPMNPPRAARKDRTALGGSIAHGDHIVERLPDEWLERFRTLTLHLDPQHVAHRLPRHRMNLRLRRAAGRRDVDRPARQVTQDLTKRAGAARRRCPRGP